MDTEFKRFEHAGHTVVLSYDTDATSPREYENLATIACWHRQMNLGDEQLNKDDFSSAQDVREYIEARAKAHGDEVLAILPVWIYEHGQIQLKCSADRPGYPFNDRWDSGLVGWAYVLKSNAEKLGCVGDYHGEEGGTWADRYAKAIEQEVDLYDRWGRGEFVGYQVLDKDGDEVASCWGFDDPDYAEQEAKDAAEHAQQADQKNREKHPVKDWQYEVANGDTLLGYEEWLKHKAEDASSDSTYARAEAGFADSRSE